jgi:hypothetical protein
VDLQQLASEIRSPIVRSLFEHWRVARGDRQVPVWRDIDATHFAQALPLISVWQVEPGGVLRGRLCGNETRYFFGHNIKGKTLDEVFPPVLVPELRALLLDVVENRVILYMRAAMPNRMLETVEYERISLPLSFDGSNCDGIISVRDGVGIVPIEQYNRDKAWTRTAENRVQL